MTPTLTPQELRDLADSMEAEYPNAAHDLRRYADDLGNALSKLTVSWNDIRHIPAGVTVTDKDGDRWQVRDGKLYICHAPNFDEYEDWNGTDHEVNNYAPFTELIGD